MKKIPGYDGYYADNLGNIYNAKGHKLIASVGSDGYLRLFPYRNGKRTNVSVHRLIALSFHGYPQDGCVVQHINGDKLDNRAENLKWGTPAENREDMIFHGTNSIPRFRRLTEQDVLDIRQSEKSNYALAAEYGVTASTIRHARHYRTWKYLP